MHKTSHVIITATLMDVQLPSLFYKRRNKCIGGGGIIITQLVRTQLGLLDSRIQTPDLYSKLTRSLSQERGTERKEDREDRWRWR